jgi:hypothetical protein
MQIAEREGLGGGAFHISFILKGMGSSIFALFLTIQGVSNLRHGRKMGTESSRMRGQLYMRLIIAQGIVESREERAGSVLICF